jgi:hypothetical protein
MLSYVDYSESSSSSTHSNTTSVKKQVGDNSIELNETLKKLRAAPSKLIKFRSSFSLSTNVEDKQFRSRSKTWPFISENRASSSGSIETEATEEYEKYLIKNLFDELGLCSNKQLKNPWGNLSYSQLIERAIESSTWKCLSLKEIYSWFTKYVPYFKDKMHFKSTTGWKVSTFESLETCG